MLQVRPRIGPNGAESQADRTSLTRPLRLLGMMGGDVGRIPGRVATIASRATTGIHGAVLAVAGILTMVIIVIAWVLFALHKLDILSAVSRTP